MTTNKLTLKNRAMDNPGKSPETLRIISAQYLAKNLSVDCIRHVVQVYMANNCYFPCVDSIGKILKNLSTDMYSEVLQSVIVEDFSELMTIIPTHGEDGMEIMYIQSPYDNKTHYVKENIMNALYPDRSGSRALITIQRDDDKSWRFHQRLIDWFVAHQVRLEGSIGVRKFS